MVTVVVVVATLATIVAADEPLTPDAAVRIAIERSGAVAAAGYTAEQKAIKRTLDIRSPTVRVGHQSIDGLVSTPHTDGNGNPYAPLDTMFVQGVVRFPTTYDALSTLGNGDAARADAEDVDNEKQQLATDVRTLHAQLLSMREEQKLAQSAFDIMTKLEAQTGDRLRAEATTALDARLATLSRIDAAADVEDMRANIVRTEDKLAALLGRPAPLSLEPPPRPLCEMPKDDLVSLLAKAKERSPKLRALTYMRSRAELVSSLSWTAYLPYFDSVGVQYFNAPLDKRDEWRAYVQFGLPIFEPLTGKSREAAIEMKRLDAIYTDEARQLEADVRSDYDRLTGALALVQLYDESRRSIEQGLADVQKALEAGQSDAFRVAEVQARAVADQRNALHARSKCEAAAIDLARLTGDVVVP